MRLFKKLRNLLSPHTGKVQDQVQGFFFCGKMPGSQVKTADSEGITGTN